MSSAMRDAVPAREQRSRELRKTLTPACLDGAVDID